jgi:dTDP-4-dehydrorhamnose reductase
VRQCCDRHIILRTAWVYGSYGKGNFVKTMLRLGAEREELRVVVDQTGSPTWARDIAQTVAQLIPQVCSAAATESSIFGTYHFTNSGVASWYDFAVAIFEDAQSIGFPLKIQQVVPITTAEYPTPALRPAYSVLSHKKITAALGEYPTHWRQQLRKMLAELYSQTHESTYSLRR